MKRREEIVRQAEIFRQPYRGSGNYSTSMDIKNAFQEGAEWADKTMIEKACKWILHNMPKYVKANKLDVFINNEDMASDFRKAMEE